MGNGARRHLEGYEAVRGRSMIEMPATLPCPFCGADADAGWVVHPTDGKSFRVKCSRDGECPSPQWEEASKHHEDDATCVKSVVYFWNTRAADWSEEGWQFNRGARPKVPVLVYTVQRAAEKNLARAIGVDAPTHQPYAIAQWQRGEWRDVVNGRIYRVRAWRHLVGPKWII